MVSGSREGKMKKSRLDTVFVGVMIIGLTLIALTVIVR
ncbi:hypothetical protein FB99_27300 [Pantoea agglomerans]|nr:hypothetical protein FB99_27300 [Pantoea agglomerans]